jgi:hypothetical protein
MGMPVIVDQRTQYAQFLIKRISKVGSICVENGVLSVSPESCQKMVAGYEADIVKILGAKANEEPAVSCVRIFSKKLGEEILLVADHEFPESGKIGQTVAYSETEIRHIKEQNPTLEEIRFLHEVKKEFGGQIVKEAGSWRTS